MKMKAKEDELAKGEYQPVTFYAVMIKEVRAFLSDAGDKTIAVKFILNAAGNEGVSDKLNDLQRGDRGVYVCVFDQFEYEGMMKEKKKS